MAGGNKKKKRPAANPARGVATTSLQSKSKVANALESDTGHDSETPRSTKPERTGGEVALLQSKIETQSETVSPDEFEAQLVASELQQFIESHAAKVKREASRQVSRLQTERRLLRGQADYLSVKSWLPDELMNQLLESILDEEEDRSSKTRDLPVGDDLITKLWALRSTLLGLDVPLARANEATAAVLRTPAEDSSVASLWGLAPALDWLAIRYYSEEFPEYDYQKQRIAEHSEESTANSSNHHSEDDEPSTMRKSVPLPEQFEVETTDFPGNQSIEVSDVDSDVDSEELLAVYLRTKTRLYELNPPQRNTDARNGNKELRGTSDRISAYQRPGEQKLKQKLKAIQSDVLFDQREADLQWSKQRIRIAQEVAQRKRLNLTVDTQTGGPTTPYKVQNGHKASEMARNRDEAELEGGDDSEEDSFIGGIFDSLPGVVNGNPAGDESANPVSLILTDFGRLTGLTPRRILEETCRSRDSRCKITYQQVSATTYHCRHRVIIDWMSDQDFPESAYIQSVNVEATHRRLTVTMMRQAAPDVTQSESYAATAALFIIVSDSPKEEKSHLRLPPAFRDVWDQFSQLKRDYVDSVDRDTVKELRDLVEPLQRQAEESEDEVIFNVASRRLNGHSGASTPTSRPLTPKPTAIESNDLLKDMWMRKTMTPSYQRTLVARINLPVFNAKDTILEAVRRNQITILVGDTGSGKSTQLPQFILENELANGRACKIYCTQPRRISAISLAQRVSEELGEHKSDLGTARSLVGYAIRLESHTGPQTRLIYATVGIVLRMMESQDGLGEITHLILDEVHERNIDTDFLLIVVRSILVHRPDLKVVLMSATVDAQKFSQYLDNAPIISVPGRTFPVRSMFLEDAIELTGYAGDGHVTEAIEDVEDTDTEPSDASKSALALSGYLPKTRDLLKTYDEYRIDNGLIFALLETIAQDSRYIAFSQAILIFVPGIQEIRKLNDMLQGHPMFSRGWRVHALHSTFSSEDQQAAFDIPPQGVRKIVIATNIAETGITIPDITCVIDTGKHREMRFDERRQMSKLTQSFIAKANAKQRRGRAGRVQEGICFHLFTRYRFENLMAEQQTPEMLRLSLQDLVMRVKICKLGDVETALSQALDPPSSKNIRRAIDALIEVGALTSAEQLTALGSQLAKLPLDAQLGKLILYGEAFGCLDFALTVAAALSSKSPFLSPMYAKKQADTVRLGFKRGDSDLLTLYNAYSAWRKVCSTPGLSEFHFCNKNFLSAQNLANIEDLKAQLLVSLTDAGIVSLDASERSALMKVRPGARHRHFVTLPSRYSPDEGNDDMASSVVAWAFYPKIIKREGKGWRNIGNNQSLALHPTSVNKTGLPADVKYLSFYSIMQSSSRFTNAQETTAVSDFALVLLCGDATFHMYAGVIVIDGNRLKFKVRDWRTMIVLKVLRSRLRKALERQLKYPGRDLGEKNKQWMHIVRDIFERQSRRERSALSAR